MWNAVTTCLGYYQPAEYLPLSSSIEDQNSEERIPLRLPSTKERTEIVGSEVLKNYAQGLIIHSQDPLEIAYQIGIMCCIQTSITSALFLAACSSPLGISMSSLAGFCIGASFSGATALCSCGCCILDLKTEKLLATLFDEDKRLRHLIDSSERGIFHYVITSKYSSEEKLKACEWLFNKGAILDWNGKDIFESPLWDLFISFCKTSKDEERDNYLKIMELFLKFGLDLNQQDKDCANLLGIIAQNSFESIKPEYESIIPFCKFLIQKGARLSWNLSSSNHSSSVLLKTFTGFNRSKNPQAKNKCVEIAKLCLSNQEETEKILNFSAYHLIDCIKEQHLNDREMWFSLYPPRIKSLGKIQSRMKRIYHAFPITNKGKNYRLGMLELDGFPDSSLVDKKYKDSFLRFIDSTLKGYCSKKTRHLIDQSLSSVFDPKAFEKFLDNPESPLLIDIGGIGHTAYLWIYADVFILVDTGTMLAKEFFGDQSSCIYGNFDRNLFTKAVFEKLLLRDKLNSKDPSYIENLNEILHIDLKVNPDNCIKFSSFYQSVGNCSASSKMMLLACIHYLSEKEKNFLADDLKNEIQGYNDDLKQYFYFLLYELVWPLYVIKQTKLFEDSNFLNEPQYLPFVEDLYNECLKCESWQKLLSYFYTIAEEPLVKMVQEDYEIVLNKLNSTLQQIEGRSETQVV